MSKETILSFLRTALSAVGAFLIGKNLFGQAVTNETWQLIIGVILALIGAVWSVLDKEAGIEQVQAAIRQAITITGSLLIAYGRLKTEQVEQIGGLITAILPFVYGWLSRKKTTMIEQRQVSLAELKKE